MRKGYKLVSFARRSQYLYPAIDATPDAQREQRRIALVMDFSQQTVLSGIHTIYRQNLSWLPSHFDKTTFVTGWRAASKLGQALVTFRFPRPGLSSPQNPNHSSPISTANSTNELFSKVPAECARVCSEAHGARNVVTAVKQTHTHTTDDGAIAPKPVSY